MITKLNKYQTPLTEELIKSLPKEVYTEMMEYIDSVQFINWLIQPEEVRGFARDKERHCDLKDTDPRKHYNDNRIVVDITKPHILEDMDFFRERALFFDKYGKYTDIRPNPNPKSEFANFWREELNRWKNGLIRSSDGEWIPGTYYFYLNYSPIWLNEIEKTTTSKKSKAKRIRKFPKPWLGDYLFFHYDDQAKCNGNHVKCLKTRGVGISFKMAALSPRNMFIERGLANFHLASDKTFLEGDKGVFGKVVDVLDHLADHSPLDKLRLVDRALEKQIGHKDPENGVIRGPKSSVFGISLKDNPDKARGIRGKLIHYEEDGLFPNLEKAWNVNRKAVEDGDIVFGTMYALGTGGVEGSNFEGSEKLFYYPKAYNVYGIPNVFDKNTSGATECGFFWGAYLNRAECYDLETGEPDVIKALIEVLQDRYLVKYNSTDPSAITQKKAEEPITPQEAVMRVDGTIFPVSDLRDYLESISPRLKEITGAHYVGELLIDTAEGIKWSPKSDIYPIRDFPLKDNKAEGAIEIFELPKKVNNKVVPNRYIAGIDSYDADQSSTTSLGSIFIFDTFTDRIVAEYTGRPKFADDFYEICRRLLIFYDSRANYENFNKGIFQYFDRKNCLYLLADTPKHLRDMEYVKGILFGNTSKGTSPNKQINSYGRRLIRDWLLTPAYSQDVDSEGNQIGEKLNMHTIRSKALLEELIRWNSDGNFDRVSSLGMCMIQRAEVQKYIDTNKSMDSYDMKDLANDPYFDNNYRRNNNSYTRLNIDF